MGGAVSFLVVLVGVGLAAYTGILILLMVGGPTAGARSRRALYPTAALAAVVLAALGTLQGPKAFGTAFAILVAMGAAAISGLIAADARRQHRDQEPAPAGALSPTAYSWGALAVSLFFLALAGVRFV